MGEKNEMDFSDASEEIGDLIIPDYDLPEGDDDEDDNSDDAEDLW